jgi:hypothetical protein
VYDAVGVRIDEVPVTPEKIVKALEDKAKGKPARYGPDAFPDIAYPEPMIVPRPGKAATATPSTTPSARRRRSSMMRLPLFKYMAPKTVPRPRGSSRTTRRARRW